VKPYDELFEGIGQINELRNAIITSAISLKADQKGLQTILHLYFNLKRNKMVYVLYPLNI
jgi:hypothetical protein